MTTVFTPMPIFDKPGQLLDLLNERGFARERISAPDAPKGAGSNEGLIQAMIDRAPEMEFLITGTVPLGKEFFAAARKLKLVAMYGVGLDHISIPEATAANVLVTNAPGGNTRCVSELAFSFMLNLAHKTVQMHTDLAAGSWRGRRGGEISGKTLGLIGFGNIARDMAKLAGAFGMRVIFANRTPRPEAARECGATQLPFDRVLAEADYISIHVPGGPNSLHFGKEEFAKMKKGAYCINTARGELVDLDALTEALRDGHLAGAGLDVFAKEPLDPSHPILTLPNVVTTPHAGGLSAEAMARVTVSCLDEIGRILKKERSPNARNPEVYATRGF